jgi:hypothetical protein
MTLPPRHNPYRDSFLISIEKYQKRELAITQILKELDDMLFTIVFQQMTPKEQLALVPLKNKIVDLISELEQKKVTR